MISDLLVGFWDSRPPFLGLPSLVAQAEAYWKEDFHIGRWLN